MKSTIQPVAVAIAVVLTALFTFTSCDPKEDPEVAVSVVSVSQTSLTLEPGGTANLTATVTPSNATYNTVWWSTSNQSVATVSNGTVTAVGEGTASIYAAAGGKTATCQVTVKWNVVYVTSVELDKYEAEMETGQDLTLTAIVKPDYATDKTVTWTSSDANIATVENGKVTAVAEGDVTIGATAGNKTVTCQVTVKKKVVDVTSVELDMTEAEIETRKDLTLTATVKPDDATDKTVTWTSSDANIATVENGKVTAVSEGEVTVTAASGGKEATCVITVKPGTLEKARRIMEKVYEAWDAKNWNDPWIPGETWPGLEYYEDSDKVGLVLKSMGLKGEIPECIGELGDLISYFNIQDAPELTGSLPKSFANLKALQHLGITNTSLTSIPDIFAGIPLTSVYIFRNDELSCPLPYSIGDSPELVSLYLHYNRFTGELPASWARLGRNFAIQNNCLTGQIPKEYMVPEFAEYNFREHLWQRNGYGLDVTDLEINGRWDYCYPKEIVNDLEGKPFSFDEVVKKNKLTIFLAWAPWCPFSKELMPELKAYYEKYHKDGLEIIATVMMNEAGLPWDDLAGQKKEVSEKGYGQWYNFYWDFNVFNAYKPATPVAEVYDSEGFVQFSANESYRDPVRKRLGRTASSDLIPFLETVFGPADTDESDYASTDYSEDQKVMTLQEATVGKGIDIVFMGDAYTDKDMKPGGLYESLMRQSMEEFFAVEPYNTFRNRFNVYAVKVVSKNGWIGDGYSTALSTHFGERSEVFCDYEKCYEYALKVPSIKSRENLLVCVLVNTKRHAGTARMFDDGTQTSVVAFSSNGNDPDIFGPTLRHEAGGHGFAFLGDEYVNSSGAAPQSLVDQYSEQATRLGWWQNIDFTNDPSKIKWSVFLSDDRYKDEVGIYEGGLFGKGVWRPSENSIMNMNFGDFNAPSRWAIYKRIMELSGEEASFDKFLEYDAVNRGKKQSSAPMTRSLVEWQPTAPPIVGP